MVPNAATECSSISAAASDQNVLRRAPCATSLAAHETIAPATAPYTAGSSTTLLRRQPGLCSPDFVLGEGGREHFLRFEKRGDVFQRVSQRLQSCFVDVQL